jgi:Bacterial Ig-like domain (group 2)
MRGILGSGFIVTLTALSLGCSSSPTEVPTLPGDPPPGTVPSPTAPVERFTVAPGSATLNAGKALQLTATAVRAGLESQVPSADVLWDSSDKTIAIVAASGLVRGLRPGQVDIRARWQANRAAVRINVLKAVSDDPSCKGGRCP